MKPDKKDINKQVLEYIVNPKNTKIPPKVDKIITSNPKMSVKHKVTEIVNNKKPEPNEQTNVKGKLGIALPTFFVGFTYKKSPRVISTNYKWFIFESPEQAKIAKKRVNDHIIQIVQKILKNSQKGGDKK